MIRNKKIYLTIATLAIFLISGSTSIFAAISLPIINSEAAVLIDASTGQVLFEKNMNKKEYPASITKIMTGMLALENCGLDDTITMTKEAVFSVERNSSHIALDTGEEILMRYALYALAVKSANDAANGIGVHVSGSLDAFSNLMNKRAKELGALNTHFVTTNGLNDPNHYTTAYDMALIMKQAIRTPHFLEFFNKKTYEIPPTNMQKNTRYLHNKNSLLTGRLKYPGLIASKTGWTTEAKHTLVTAAKRGNRVLIVVAMNSPDAQDKYNDTMSLFDYGFNDFEEISVNNEQLISALPDNGDSKSLKRLIETKNPKITRLLHKSLSVNDISLNYKMEKNDGEPGEKLKLQLNLKDHSDAMPGSMGSVVIGEPVEQSESIFKPVISVLLKILKVLMYSILSLLGFAIFRKLVIRYLRYKHRKNG